MAKRKKRGSGPSLHKATGVYYMTHQKRRIYFTRDEKESRKRYLENKLAIENGSPLPWGGQKDAPLEVTRKRGGPLYLREGLELAIADKERRTKKRQYGLRKANDQLIRCCGGDRPIKGIGPAEFSRFMTLLEREYVPSTIGWCVANVKAEFRWLWNDAHIDELPRYGNRFQRPSIKKVRLHKEDKKKTHGDRFYSAEEIRGLIDACETRLQRCIVLLGINMGFGQADCAALEFNDLDLQHGWLDGFRPKAGMIARGGKLWDATVDALRDYIEHERPPSSSPKVFAGMDAKQIGRRFAPLPERAGCKRVGMSVYGLRHSFETLAGASKDQRAVDHIMGHAEAGSAKDYREKFFRERLEEVAEVVRKIIEI